MISIQFLLYANCSFSYNRYSVEPDTNCRTMDTSIAVSGCEICEYDTICYYMLFNGIRRYDTTYNWEISGHKVGNDTITFYIYNQNEIRFQAGEAGSLCPVFGGFFGSVGPWLSSVYDTGYGAAMIVSKCKPVAKIDAIKNIYCSGENVFIKSYGTHKPTNYEWYISKNYTAFEFVSNDTDFNQILYDTGFYNLMHIVSNERGADTIYIQFEIIPTPDIIGSKIQNIDLNNTTQTILEACSTAEQYEWFPQENLTCTICESTTATISTDANYYCVASNKNGCKETCYYNITLPFDIFVPTAFTPNNDGVNDLFKVRGVNIEVQNCIIYNRLGNEIYNGNLQNGWNGIYKNELVETGVYAYQLNYINKKTNSTLTQKGNITVIR